MTQTRELPLYAGTATITDVSGSIPEIVQADHRTLNALPDKKAALLAQVCRLRPGQRALSAPPSASSERPGSGMTWALHRRVHLLIVFWDLPRQFGPRRTE
jgi:hypothetical protein